MEKKRDLQLYTADLNDQDFEEIRALSEYAIEQKMFEEDPIKCVINAYVTHLVLKAKQTQTIDQVYFH